MLLCFHHSSRTVGSVEGDRAVLRIVYDVTNGPAWKEKKGWKLTPRLKRWYGVEADDEGRVVKIILGGIVSGNNLQGEEGALLVWLLLSRSTVAVPQRVTEHNAISYSRYSRTGWIYLLPLLN